MGKSWPEGQVVESGSETPPAAVPSVAISTAAAASATTAAAEGPELELPVPSATATAALAAVAATSITGLALVLDRADVEGGVHRLDRLVRLRHRPVFADVQPDVASHEGHVAVVDQDRLTLLALTDLLVPQGARDPRGLVPNRRLDELSRFAELRRDLSLFTQPDDLHQDIYLLGCGGQVFHFRHCLFVHAFTSADTSRRVAKGREKPPPGEFRRCGLALLTNRCYKNIRRPIEIGAGGLTPIASRWWATGVSLVTSRALGSLPPSGLVSSSGPTGPCHPRRWKAPPRRRPSSSRVWAVGR